MKPGLHSWSRREAFKNDDQYDAYRFIDEAADWGFEHVELMTGKAPDNLAHIPSEDIGELEQLMSYASNKGVTIDCWSTYNDFSFTPNEEWRIQNIEYIEKWIIIAKQTGVPNLRFLTGYIPEGEDVAALEQMVIDGTKRCVALAEEHGVNLALENHNALFMYADDIKRFFEMFKSDRLTTCPDPSNGFNSIFKDGPDDETMEKLYANAEALIPMATNAHLKVQDAQFSPFDLERLLGMYQAHGFTSTVQFEMIGDNLDKPEILGEARQHFCDTLSRLQSSPA